MNLSRAVGLPASSSACSSKYSEQVVGNMLIKVWKSSRISSLSCDKSTMSGGLLVSSLDKSTKEGGFFHHCWMILQVLPGLFAVNEHLKVFA